MCFSTIEQAETWLAEIAGKDPEYVRQQRRLAIQDVAYYTSRNYAEVTAEFDQRDAARAAEQAAAKSRTTAYVNDFVAQLNAKIAEDQAQFERVQA